VGIVENVFKSEPEVRGQGHDQNN